LKIEITDINDNFPQFENFDTQLSDYNEPIVYELKITLEENVALNTKILEIHAVDFDKEKNLTYSIDANNEYFKIDKFTGSLYVKNLIDYEVVKWINVSIYANDNDKIVPKFSELRVYCKIKDLNDNSPLFTHISSNNFHLNHHNESYHNVTVRIKQVISKIWFIETFIRENNECFNIQRQLKLAMNCFKSIQLILIQILMAKFSIILMNYTSMTTIGNTFLLILKTEKFI
jgi:hypothetical protein